MVLLVLKLMMSKCRPESEKVSRGHAKRVSFRERSLFCRHASEKVGTYSSGFHVCALMLLKCDLPILILVLAIPALGQRYGPGVPLHLHLLPLFRRLEESTEVQAVVTRC